MATTERMEKNKMSDKDKQISQKEFTSAEPFILCGSILQNQLITLHGKSLLAVQYNIFTSGAENLLKKNQHPGFGFVTILFLRKNSVLRHL